MSGRATGTRRQAVDEVAADRARDIRHAGAERSAKAGARPSYTADTMVVGSLASEADRRALDGAVIQLRAAVAAARRRPTQEPDVSDRIRAAAARGVARGGGTLPYAEQIQRSFGRHDIGGIRAHEGDDATEAATAIGARAYATGSDVAFAGVPDLHTAAHEAAHVVQQRAGVSLSGGVGRVGDPYERHADAVADAVVDGQGAEALLDEMAPNASAPATSAGAGVQRRETLGLRESWRRLVRNFPTPTCSVAETRVSLETALRTVEESTRFVEATAGTRSVARVQRVRARLRQLRGRLGTATDICNAMGDVNSIVQAANTLEEIGDFSQDRDKARQAAVAFGQLFVGLGGLAEHLPPPLDGYATFLQGAETFFSDVLNGIDPMTRQNGRELRSIRDRDPRYHSNPCNRQDIVREGPVCP